MLTRKQYEALLNLYHECNDAFCSMHNQYKTLFFDYLYERKSFSELFNEESTS